MTKIFMLTTALTLLLFVPGQGQSKQTTDTIPGTVKLEEVVISATNFIEKNKNIAQKIDVITAATIAQSNSQNTGDLLLNTGKIFVQKSQQGGSSPVLRGFEASRILLVIDGVRMNNAIYRSGHLQNVITTDQNSLSRVEIMYGPSSTIYGSDALGGTIHFITKAPMLSETVKTAVTGSGFTRYSSSNNEKTIHADISIGGKKIAWFQGYNFSDFDDMKMGDDFPDNYPDFGRRLNYIGSVNGKDSIMSNPDDRVQKFSGYRQWDITQKLLFKPSASISHLLNLQLSNSSNVPRYDRLQDVRNGALRYAEWYYGPQKRMLAAYEMNVVNVGIFKDLKMNLNYQDIEESRQTRDYQRYDRFDSRIEKVKVFGGNISGRIVVGANELTIGADVQLNDVKSTAFRKNLITNLSTSLDTRYPDGKNRLNNFGIFAQHIYKFKNKKLILNDGIRLQATHLKSNVKNNSFFNLPETSVQQNNFAVTGNIGLAYNPTNNTTLKIGIASAFRAPNIDDLAKIFESSTVARQVVVPNADLQPEYTHNIDLSLYQKIFNKIDFEITGYYTIFNNAIIKAPFRLNGQDSILYNGTRSQVLASQNVNRANLYGFSGGLNWQINKSFHFNSTVSYTAGRFKTDALKPSTIYEKQPNGKYLIVQRSVKSKPLDHIPPILGKTSVIYKKEKFSATLFFMYNGWKRLDQYNADGEDNAQYATADGMPGWFTANISGSLTLSQRLQIQAGIENLLDRNYRYFAAGFSAAGRNYIISLRANF